MAHEQLWFAGPPSIDALSTLQALYPGKWRSFEVPTTRPRPPVSTIIHSVYTVTSLRFYGDVVPDHERDCPARTAR